MRERTLKQLVGALAVVVVLWVAAMLLSRGGDGSLGESADVTAYFAGITADAVTEVRVVRPGDTIELRSEGGSWRVNGFRSDSGSVARFFDALGAAEVGGLAATNPANHERMGVSADSARTVELQVGGSMRAMMFGKDGPRASTIYARLPGADDVYVVEGAIRAHLTRQLDDWRNRKMLAIDTSRVARIDVRRDEDSFALVRADTAWTFQDGSPVRASQVQSILGELGGGLVASRFVAEDDSLAALPEGGATVAYSAGGDVLAEVSVGSGAGERWAVVVGDSVRYRLPSFRANLIVPTLESVRPPEG